VELAGDLAGRGLALERLREDAVGPLDALKQLFLAVGEADSAAAVDQGARDGLSDPPRGVGRESDQALSVEFFGSLDEAYVAFLYEVEKGHVRRDVGSGDFHDQAEIRLDQPPSRFLVARENPHRKVALFFGR